MVMKSPVYNFLMPDNFYCLRISIILPTELLGTAYFEVWDLIFAYSIGVKMKEEKKPVLAPASMSWGILRS